ncbi:MAG: hypothetical protein MI749_12775 [Desulfovibrionales bacterium]|nr:hypothetical protein [Desulfovibrionales bacterium]
MICIEQEGGTLIWHGAAAMVSVARYDGEQGECTERVLRGLAWSVARLECGLWDIGVFTMLEDRMS